MESRISTVLPALIAGILIGALLMQFVAPPISGTSVPSHTLSTATGCQDAADPRGWVAVVPDSDHRSVYLSNYSYVHAAPNVQIRGELTESGPTTWDFAISVTPETSEKEVPEECQPRSVINAAIALPTEAESLTISIEGETIVAVDTTSSWPRVSNLER